MWWTLSTFLSIFLVLISDQVTITQVGKGRKGSGPSTCCVAADFASLSASFFTAQHNGKFSLQRYRYKCPRLISRQSREKESACSHYLRKKGFSPLILSDFWEVLRYQAADIFLSGTFWCLCSPTKSLTSDRVSQVHSGLRGVCLNGGGSRRERKEGRKEGRKEEGIGSRLEGHTVASSSHPE